MQAIYMNVANHVAKQVRIAKHLILSTWTDSIVFEGTRHLGFLEYPPTNRLTES